MTTWGVYMVSLASFTLLHVRSTLFHFIVFLFASFSMTTGYIFMFCYFNTFIRPYFVTLFILVLWSLVRNGCMLIHLWPFGVLALDNMLMSVLQCDDTCKIFWFKMNESQRGSSLTLKCKLNDLSLSLVIVYILIMNSVVSLMLESTSLEHPDFNFVSLTFLCLKRWCNRRHKVQQNFFLKHSCCGKHHINKTQALNFLKCSKGSFFFFNKTKLIQKLSHYIQ